MRSTRVAIAALLAACAPIVLGQSAVDEIEKYRQALQEGNPAELWEARGEALWKAPRGPNKVSFEKCDLGLGAGACQPRARNERSVASHPIEPSATTTRTCSTSSASSASIHGAQVSRSAVVGLF